MDRAKSLLVSGAFLILTITCNASLGGELRDGLASNANFNVLADNQELAEKVAKKADELRLKIAKEWLGEPIPNGFGPASVNIFFSDRNTARTWLIEEKGERDAHLIWIYTRPKDLDTALAHEVAHVVLANQYPDLPAFAHEAIASSYDGEHRKKIRLSTLKWFVKTDRWPRLRRLFNAESIEPSNHSSYTAAVSIKDFLLSTSNGDKTRFLDFTTHGKKQGWDSALQQYYGFVELSHCELEWQKWAQSQLAEN